MEWEASPQRMRVGIDHVTVRQNWPQKQHISVHFHSALSSPFPPLCNAGRVSSFFFLLIMVRHVGITVPYRSQLRLPSSILKLFYPDAGPSPKYGSRRTWSENSLKPRPFKLT